jgi:hypothetical protein
MCDASSTTLARYCLPSAFPQVERNVTIQLSCTAAASWHRDTHFLLLSCREGRERTLLCVDGAVIVDFFLVILSVLRTSPNNSLTSK